MNSPYAVIIGLYGPNALGLVRSLGEEEIPMIGIRVKSQDPSIAMYSKYLDPKDVYTVETFADITDTLAKIANIYHITRENKGIVFVSDEDPFELLYKHYSKLEEFYKLPIIPERDPIELMDKITNVYLAKGSAFGIPESCRLSQYKPLEAETVITKSVNSIVGDKRDMFLLSREELENQLPELRKRYSKTDLIIQEYFKPEKLQDFVSINAYCDKDSNGWVSGMYKRIHARASNNSLSARIYSTSYESFSDIELENAAVKLVEQLRFPYPINIDLVYNREKKKYYILEINLRQGMDHYGQTKAGHNLPAIVYFDIIGDTASKNKLQQKEYKSDHLYFYENRELAYLLMDRDGSLKKNLQDLKKRPRFFTYWSLADIKPFLYQSAQECKYYLNMLKR